MPGHLYVIAFVWEVGMCVFVYLPPKLLITGGLMWLNMDPHDWLKRLYRFYMAAIVSIISRRGLRIKHVIETGVVLLIVAMYNNII